MRKMTNEQLTGRIETHLEPSKLRFPKKPNSCNCSLFNKSPITQQQIFHRQPIQSPDRCSTIVYQFVDLKSTNDHRASLALLARRLKTTRNNTNQAGGNLHRTWLAKNLSMAVARQTRRLSSS